MAQSALEGIPAGESPYREPKSRCFRFRLVAAGDPARLNVSRHGYQTFDDGMVKRPQHLRYRPFNAGRPIQQRDS